MTQHQFYHILWPSQVTRTAQSQRTASPNNGGAEKSDCKEYGQGWTENWENGFAIHLSQWLLHQDARK